jgi:hypothetical protein
MSLNENFTNDWQQIQSEMLKNNKWKDLFHEYQEISYDEAQVMIALQKKAHKLN